MYLTGRELEMEVQDLLVAVLKLETVRDPNLHRRSVREWDSLKHMEIVFALEDRYGVQFDESEFATLDGPAAIAVALRRHLAP